VNGSAVRADPRQRLQHPRRPVANRSRGQRRHLRHFDLDLLLLKVFFERLLDPNEIRQRSQVSKAEESGNQNYVMPRLGHRVTPARGSTLSTNGARFLAVLAQSGQHTVALILLHRIERYKRQVFGIEQLPRIPPKILGLPRVSTEARNQTRLAAVTHSATGSGHRAGET